MVNIKCTLAPCEFETGDVTEAVAVALLANHGISHQTPNRSTVPAALPPPQAPKLDRPTVDIGVTIEEWNAFVRRWEVFRQGSGIDERAAPAQLFQCAGQELGDSLLKVDPKALSIPLKQLLAKLRSLAVIPVAISVLRTELLQLRQERGELFRTFATRVRGKAETCAYAMACTCGQSVDYTDQMIRDVLLNGIVDSDIRRDVLGTRDILNLPVNELISIVEGKETAQNATPSPSNLSAVSMFRKQKALNNTVTTGPSEADKSKTASCPECKVTYHTYTESARGWNTKPHKICIDCFRARRRQNKRVTPQRDSASVKSIELGNPISQIAALKSTKNQTSCQKYVPIALDHQIFSKGEWKRARLRDHPTVPIMIALDTSTQSRYTDIPTTANVHAEVTAIADTGAQSDLLSLSDFLACGFPREQLIPVNMNLSAANRSPISIEGAFFANLTTTTKRGTEKSCRSMVYVSSSIQAMYLSYESLLNLSIIQDTFPHPQDCEPSVNIPDPAHELPPINAIRAVSGGCSAPCTDSDIPCSCPQRESTPLRPLELPFPCTPENNSRMKTWLLERYSSSTFNTCPHRALPSMEGPPIEIHVDPSALPKTCHTPAPVPLHWQQRVYEDLLRDEALGVIERVPYGEPVVWCHRMVITRKHNGSPRRTVDLSPLNKYCQRETFAMEPPFHLARRIPKDTWKTVTDAWNGYHSVPLRQSDRHLTTFITPFGRWRYTRAPQGFLSSGDGYNRRFDAILSSFERKERCVDDTIHYDSDLEQHWWRTIDFLTRVGQAGMVLNPDKFQFAEREVEFAGFRVTDSTIEPLPKYLDAIRDFPVPTSTTDIRSWFGLVNQVSNYAQLREVMEPFKPFLSPRCKFSWSSQLDEAFQQSKLAIIDSIRHGVQIFDLNKPTCLRPDWSKQGIGYFLLQQHCNCQTNSPDCCAGGWKITLAGSRFLSSAEQRYAAIEGEALAVAWGLEQTRYFTQGCDKLLVVTDHKPLVKIFGDRTLDEITNSRLFRLKQRTLLWRFTIKHLPGTSNHAADATSRHPSPSGHTESAHLASSIPDMAECALMSAICSNMNDVSTISWSTLSMETAADESLSQILKLIERNALHEASAENSLTAYRPILESMYVQDGVLLYQDRVIVPPSLRQKVLHHLHAAHQGTSRMEQRARAIVFWPGMSNDIRETRESCIHCNRNAPSQAATPPLPNPPPSTPFDAIFADFFKCGGHQYLVVGDRLSGWVEVYQSTAGSSQAGATGLIRHLRSFFASFGVPEELSSDGGPEFTAGATESFLQLWGVKHRISSAYFPQSNGRAEVAVKTAKRLLMANTNPTGSLDQDKFVRAILQLRNTPDPDCNVSPAQIIFGRPLRDSLSFANRLEKFSNPHIRTTWRQAWSAKEEALRSRFMRTTESLSDHSRPLRPLACGEKVFIQNQHGSSPTKWDRSGTVVETLDHDQYRIKVDGSGRLTLRNRRFLRAYTPATPYIDQGIAPAPTTAESDPPKPPPPSPHATPPVKSHTRPPAPQYTDCADFMTSPLLDSLQDAPTIEDIPPVPVAMDIPGASEPAPSAVSEQPHVMTRPKRVRRAPKRYEPESGRWVDS